MYANEAGKTAYIVQSKMPSPPLLYVFTLSTVALYDLASVLALFERSFVMYLIFCCHGLTAAC